jgi:8-oxo-dGTP pyrophosphatase MutT (NUDIX family)
MSADPSRIVKAVAYVTRGTELLVFCHRDVPMTQTGVQVPAGTVRDGELPDQAAVREVAEETGRSDLQLVRALGTAEYDIRPTRHEIHERHFFHFVASDDVPGEWVSFEEHDGLQPPTALLFSWLPIADGHVLAGGMGAMLHSLEA